MAQKRSKDCDDGSFNLADKIIVTIFPRLANTWVRGIVNDAGELEDKEHKKP
jgi:hypothetical protein